MLLTDYAIDHGYYITDVYIDDDFSGLYCDRPAFHRLITDAKLQKFNIILVKTQSRFTRNMEHVEKYLHTDFPLLGIRFIGVVDGTDTSVKSNKKTRQINGLINEWYSEDLSDNIKSVFREKMKKGQFLGSFTCYGYQKDPKDKHHMVIDEEAANIVRQIFDLSFEGYGVNIIAKNLTARNIPTPTIYKQQHGLKFYNPNDNSYSHQYGIWSTTTLKRILSNETYTGTLIQGREKKVNYKNKKIVIAPKEEWIVVKNNHEPIISKELFIKTQELLHQRRKICNSNQSQPHIFSSKIKCADCGSTMVKTSGKSGGGYDYFVCQLSRKTNGKACTRHAIRYEDIKVIIEGKIRDLFKEYSYNNIDYLKNRIPFEDTRKTYRDLKAKLTSCQTELNNLYKSITALYIDKVTEKIKEIDFTNMKKCLDENINILI